MSEDNIEVRERKFNGTSTLKVFGADNRDQAKAYAERFWREEYGHDPSKVVAEKHGMVSSRWDVMVANHSSGSLKDSKEYEKVEY